jgi:hypothetical protein
MPKKVCVSINHDEKLVRITIERDKNQEQFAIRCDNPNQTRTFLEEVLNSIVGASMVRLETVEEGQVENVGEW